MLAQGHGTASPAYGVRLFGRGESEDRDLYTSLLAQIIEDSGAESGWLSRFPERDRATVVLTARKDLSPIPLLALEGLPDPPLSPCLVSPVLGPESWKHWCSAHEIQWCVVTPIIGQDETSLGTIGLVRPRPGTLAPALLPRLTMAAQLAAEAWKRDRRIHHLESQLDQVNRIVDTLAVDRVLTNVSDRNLAGAVGRSLDATYCLIAVLRGSRLVVLGWGGHRPPVQLVPAMSWPLSEVASCEEALVTGRPVFLDFDQSEFYPEPERERLFSATTKAGTIVPFGGAWSQGVLLVGEERHSQRESISQQGATLEFLAKRVGEILGTTKMLRHSRRSQRRQQKRFIETTERARLALGLHDDVGQALHALLTRVRWAITQRVATGEDLLVLEAAAKDALNAARALTYGLRHPDGVTESLEGARHYCETILGAADCRLCWSDDRQGAAPSSKAIRELVPVIKESIVNIVRHAYAKDAEVRLESRNDRVRVTIKDNGIGFDPGEVRVNREGQGLGLLGNAERMKRVGGIFEIESSPAGTRVIIEVPIRHVGRMVARDADRYRRRSPAISARPAAGA